MLFTKKVHAEIVEKISSTHHTGIVRDFKAEDYALGEKRDRSWGSGWDSNERYDEWEREDSLHDYASSHWDVYVKKDEWTNETILVSEQSWYKHIFKDTILL